MVKDALHHWSRRLGCPAIKEPKNLVKGQERADNLIALPGAKLVLCDVSVVHPSAPTHVNRGQEQLAVAEFAASEKRKQYTAMANQEGAEFIPIIAEVFGGLHSDAVSFFKRLSWLAETDAACPWSRIEALVGITSAISIAIQLGNLMAFDRVHLNNRTAGLVPSRPRPRADAPLLLQAPADMDLQLQYSVVPDPPGSFGDVVDQTSPLDGQRQADPAQRARVIIGRSHLRSARSHPISKASRRSQPRLSQPGIAQVGHSEFASLHRRVIVHRLSMGSGRGRVGSRVAARSRQFLSSRASRRQEAVALISAVVRPVDVDQRHDLNDDDLQLPEVNSAGSSLDEDNDDVRPPSFDSDANASRARRQRRAF
jgi:hypothetical protein